MIPILPNLFQFFINKNFNYEFSKILVNCSPGYKSKLFQSMYMYFFYFNYSIYLSMFHTLSLLKAKIHVGLCYK